MCGSKFQSYFQVEDSSSNASFKYCVSIEDSYTEIELNRNAKKRDPNQSVQQKY